MGASAPEAKTTKQVKMVNQDMTVRYSEQVQVDTHLYKLVEAPVIKYMGIEKESLVSPHDPSHRQDFIDMGHAHIFRTVDSDGRTHSKCVPIGGHYHVLELEYPEGKDKAPIVVGMSGPMKGIPTKINGKTIIKDMPVNHWDDHIHDVQYLKSEKIQTRKSNQEAQIYIAQKTALPSAPGGIGEAKGRE